jgi:hypothetical protein
MAAGKAMWSLGCRGTGLVAAVFVLIVVQLAQLVQLNLEKSMAVNTNEPHFGSNGNGHPARTCYQEFEVELRPFVLEWYKMNLPVLSSVKLLQVKGGMPQSHYYSVVFVDLGNSHQRKKFLCNGKYEASFDEKVTQFVVLKCPPELDPSKEPLTGIAFVDEENPETAEPIAYYDTRKALECELLDIKFFSPVEPMIILGAVSIFAGGEKGRKEALQWAEYHHIIGVEHIWLYVNEHWDYKDHASFDRSYISWITL